jgi:hypothetical protein
MGRSFISGACNSYSKDSFMSVDSSGDGSGNHKYDLPGSYEHPLSPVRKWNKARQEWE